MKFLPLIIICLLLSYACVNIANKANESSGQESSKSICQCGRVGMDFNLIPIAGLDDSIVVCKSGTINGETWVDFLHHNKLLSSDQIINCKTNERMNPVNSSNSYSISYANKALIVYTNRDFSYFHALKKAWKTIEIEMYKEQFYAEKGKIKRSKAELIFTPLQYNQQTIKETDKRFLQKKENPHHLDIAGRLLLAALSGDELSRERLLAFRATFPNDIEDQLIDAYIEILKDFQRRAKEGKKIDYLDKSKYTDLKNYR